ncbi:30S ribosomal protein S8 [Candidatus Peregrinibacteria bacterium]|jgi:small subunit ribosomal protein S8|nr:30S ribosomal protein S8 [Candidatus Peregrinibacteria bacterium]MBT3599083.1 30S ribosomal protein S8 [Candidatus Peregrinibacteria bacterium]MBT4367682.1 30S ribosomal protein S8 [Candidatus Peregrinibacteria bacterium]MBT4585632.1 30S ribosomal protein S8 [Candidatus Peregrinibacteria bacterium]MBT6730389.1 30S ribosomal protein S8 [Candidatus Peregrinibacteria bacterium]
MTYVTDPIGDLLTRIRNAQAVGQDSCVAPFSRMKFELLETLKKNGWIEDVEKIGEDPKFDIVVTFSKERDNLGLTRVSKPGRRIYEKSSSIRPVLNGFGISLISTSKGIMTDSEAREKKLGGEVLCKIT